MPCAVLSCDRPVTLTVAVAAGLPRSPDQYLAALLKHDPAQPFFLSGVRFTENTAAFLLATACGWARRKLPPLSRSTGIVHLRIQPGCFYVR